MTSPIQPWLSQAEAQRLFCELADANLDAAQRRRERDILQHALDEARARFAELEAARDFLEEARKDCAANIKMAVLAERDRLKAAHAQAYKDWEAAAFKGEAAAREAEREACAQIAEQVSPAHVLSRSIASAIRARPAP